MKQLSFNLDLDPFWNGMSWCCCPHINKRHSLVWHRNNQKQGTCVYCGKTHTFDVKYGNENYANGG